MNSNPKVRRTRRFVLLLMSAFLAAGILLSPLSPAAAEYLIEKGYSADFGARPEKGDLATVNGTTYTVFEVAIDPAGGASLSMKKHG